MFLIVSGFDVQKWNFLIELGNDKHIPLFMIAAVIDILTRYLLSDKALRRIIADA